MGDDELRTKLSAKEVLFSRMTPKNKMRVVSILKEEGEIVAVTGDGVNDAPALKKADIGIAMGITGSDVAKEASDMILLDDNFATIVNAVEEGRVVYENIKKFITYIFASNIPEAIPYLAYILLRIPLPLTIIQILAVDLGTDMLPALALGAENPTPGIMKQPPRKLKERLLDFPLLPGRICSLAQSKPLPACSVSSLFCTGEDGPGEKCSSQEAVSAGNNRMSDSDHHHADREYFCMPFLERIRIQHRFFFKQAYIGVGSSRTCTPVVHCVSSFWE